MRARGLKRERLPERYGMAWVAPHAGAWIETRDTTARCSRVFVAPHAGAWIETGQYGPCRWLPARRAPCGRVD